MPDQLLDLNAHHDFVGTVCSSIEEKADRRGRALNAVWANRHVAALLAFAGYVRGLHPTRDRYIVTLAGVNAGTAIIRRAQGEEARELEFKPTPRQSRVLETLADNGAAPDLEVTMKELCACGVRDLVDAQRIERERLTREADAAREQAGDSKTEAESHQIGETALADAFARIEDLQEQLAEKNELLKELGDPDTTQPRRVKVDGLVGIYLSLVDGVEVYEVTWSDGGKTRWKRIGPDLTEARRARAELAGEPPPETPRLSVDPDAAYEAALSAKEKEKGQPLTDEEMAAVGAELQPLMATAGEEI